MKQATKWMACAFPLYLLKLVLVSILLPTGRLLEYMAHHISDPYSHLLRQFSSTTSFLSGRCD